MGQLIECTPSNRIVIVDADKYASMKEIASLNEKEISDRSQEMYFDYIKTTGVKIEYRISGCKELLRNEVVTDIQNDTWSSSFKLSEEVNNKIAQSLEAYISNFYKNYREEAIEIYKSEWNKNNKRRKKRALTLYVIIGILAVSNIIFAIL